MRSFLDGLYRVSLGAAALCLLLILLIVLMQVGFNLLDRALQWTGARPLGLLIPSYAELSGYLLAGASFLALAGTFRKAAHIRVTLFLGRFGKGTRQAFEATLLGLALIIVLYLGFFLGRLTWQSLSYGDLSPGLLPIPLWLPQSVMCAGVLILAVAILDDWLAALGGRDPAFRLAEAEAEASFGREGGEP